MKKLFTIIVLAAMTLTAFAQQKKVAVYVIGEDAGINKVLGSKLVSAIARSDEFSAIERTESFLAELSKEQNYQRTGAVDDNDISRLGKQFGVQYVCVAAVSDAFNEKYLSARLINVESAQVERTASSTGAIQSLDGIINAANIVSSDLLKGLGSGSLNNSKKVAVYVVRNEAGKNIGRVLGDKLVDGFTKSGKYIAIERTNSFLAQLSKEQNYQQSGAVDDNDLSRLGKQFGVQYVCVADVSDVFGEKFISARLVDVETAEIVNSHDVGGALNDMSSCLKMTNEIAANLSKGTFAEQRLKEEAERKRKEELKRQGYVDLGLPSGTLWKAENEDCGLIKYDQAVNFYGKEQFEELKNNCLWTRQGNGYKVQGKTGESIFLPAAGYRYCDGSSYNGGSYGGYWSSTPDGSERAWYLRFYSGEVSMSGYDRCYGRSVRTIRSSRKEYQ